MLTKQWLVLTVAAGLWVVADPTCPPRWLEGAPLVCAGSPRCECRLYVDHNEAVSYLIQQQLADDLAPAQPGEWP